MALDALLDHLKSTAALSEVAGLLSWDQEAMMPAKGAPQRAEQAGALAAVIHERRADPRVADWVAAIDEETLTPEDRCNVAEARRAYDRATKVPAALAAEMAKATSAAHVTWAAARAASDYAAFAPALTQIVALKREMAACLAEDGQSPYDALLDEFEPGQKVETLAPLLEGLRPRLTALREKIAEKPAPKGLSGLYPKGKQLALSRKVAKRIGYDFDAGRLDIVVHPFCSGAGGDVRITTRTVETDPFNCLYSTIHEVGHALYNQGLTAPITPATDYCSMGVHESQSRFWENQIGRSRPFAEWLYPAAAEAFDALSVDGPEAFYAAANAVTGGFIRTEADEVHYNLHILLRFELERDIISGALDIADLEVEWNTRFERDFGIAPPNAALGVLQDVHWSAGLFGYFPTYSLGNVYAAFLDRAMRKDMPDRDEMVAKAETQPILDWLRARIHHRGKLLSAPALIEEATGEAPSAEPLLDYLEAKFSALYDL